MICELAFVADLLPYLQIDPERISFVSTQIGPSNKFPCKSYKTSE